jgi:hypothetical protein
VNSNTATDTLGVTYTFAASYDDSYIAAYMAFDRNVNTAWEGHYFQYDADTGEFGAGQWIETLAEGTAYAGDWLQVSTSVAVRIFAIDVTVLASDLGGTGYGIVTGTILGSNDGATWVLVSPFDVPAGSVQKVTTVADPYARPRYLYHRFVVGKLQANTYTHVGIRSILVSAALTG